MEYDDGIFHLGQDFQDWRFLRWTRDLLIEVIFFDVIFRRSPTRPWPSWPFQSAKYHSPKDMVSESCFIFWGIMSVMMLLLLMMMMMMMMMNATRWSSCLLSFLHFCLRFLHGCWVSAAVSMEMDGHWLILPLHLDTYNGYMMDIWWIYDGKWWSYGGFLK